MKITIKDKQKCDIFVNIFQCLKLYSEHINIHVTNDKFVTSGLDRSHVSFYDLNIHKDWFDEYELDEFEQPVIGINSSIMFKILHTKQENQTLSMEYAEGDDRLKLSFISEDIKDINNFFEMPLVDIDVDNIQVPKKEGEAEFIIPTKKFCVVMEQLGIFDDVFRMICTDEGVNCIVDGTEGKMDIAMSLDTMIEYSIDEDTTVENNYSTKLINKVCNFNKISPNINLSISNNYPIEIKYCLGTSSSAAETGSADAGAADGDGDEDDKTSYMRFLIAPQIDND